MGSEKRLLAEWKIYNARVHADTKAAPITLRDVENAFYAGGLSSLLIVAREKAKDPQAEQRAALEIFEEALVITSSFK